MGFYGVKVTDDFDVITIHRNNPDRISSERVCMDCGRSDLTPINSNKATKIVGRMPKEIPHPDKIKDPAGNPVMIVIYVPKTVKGRICCTCTSCLRPDSYQNKHGENIGVFRNADNQIVTIHFENEPNATVNGYSKSDREPDRLESPEQEVREVWISKTDTVYVPVAKDVEPVDSNSFQKFGFSRGKDYRKYLKG